MKKILVIDDNEAILEAFKLMLGGVKYKVNTATGEDARIIDPKNIPDLIILDVLLSGVHGGSICKKLKSQENTSHIPVIMISAHPGGREAAQEAGADDFIAKPFDRKDMLAIIKKHL